ncbi:MAG TPA: FAD:protein FMN transferase [Anaerolineales bacterium]|nr:FAD:protein FMN transferase [Anaerolineales bacterium]
MKQTRLLMGMPVTVEVVDPWATEKTLESVYDYLGYVDRKFSTYKPESEISQINRDELPLAEASDDMKAILTLAEQTRQETDGYFEIVHNGKCDPSGIVKGWAIQNAAERLRQAGFANYYVDAGGDIQVSGRNAQGEAWRVGIRHPFRPDQIVKVLSLQDCGIATSGTYVRGQHIYDPKNPDRPITDIVSLTVIGPNVYEADRFATPAFAMGAAGIQFIEELEGLEGYMIDRNGRATFTSGFERYVLHA